MGDYFAEVVLFDDGSFELKELLDLDEYQTVSFQIVEVPVPYGCLDVDSIIGAELEKRGLI
ncbi:hypothetical protein THMIRHAS_17070 [Thiosulfatimonas sediminis]|uniref:Uncharacterized protein n=1 Tax=Thiosulfatimonas sediminis TaxID=2675054 RepID=A0A6F8PWF3_9GAMM|nr:hypothetical protein [Thiosulfatimonas sediminis]BBP46334.1 hypothetical protein THMIRHAS_17070 [Thiosulfatimonas sediminis]